MGKYRYEQCIMGASFYYSDIYICTVSGMEDAERLKNLLDENEKRIRVLEGTLKCMLDSMVEMDFNKQKELIFLTQSLLSGTSKCVLP